MTNPFYTPTGNPGPRADGLSSIMRTEFTKISEGFDQVAPFSAEGNYSTIFVQFGDFTFSLPAGPGTLALISDVLSFVATETVARTAAVSAEATTRATADTTEATARAAADTAEATTRATADTTETNARIAADATEVTNRNAAIAVETARATAAEALLMGPTWHSVTSFRVLTTTYTNSRAYPISVLVTTATGGGGGGSLLSVTIAGVVISAGQSAAIAGNYNTYFQVPAGQTYAVGGGGTMTSWFELY